MENRIMMPAGYLALNEEEMTYTEGGATAVQAVCAWIVPFYGWWKGVTAIRDWRRSHPDEWIESGMNAYTAHLETGVVNAVYDVGVALCVGSSLASFIGIPIDALIIFS